jgi:hypothetical protein
MELREIAVANLACVLRVVSLLETVLALAERVLLKLRVVSVGLERGVEM